MKRAQLLVILAGGAAVAYLLLRKQGGEEPQTFTVDMGGGARGGAGLTGLGAAVGAGLSAIPGVGPALGGIAAAGGAALEGYANLDPAQKATLKNVGEKLPNLNPLYYGLRKAGVISDATDTRRGARRGLQAQVSGHLQQTEGAEAHMLRQLHALSRPDVEWWKIDQAGTTHVKYAGNPLVHRVAVPYNADHPLAWALELTTRLFGAPVQAGYGPINGDLALDETSGFMDGNLFAPKRLTVEESKKFLAAMQTAIERKHR